MNKFTLSAIVLGLLASQAYAGSYSFKMPRTAPITSNQPASGGSAGTGSNGSGGGSTSGGGNSQPQAAACTTAWGASVTHGTTVLGYSASSVASGSSCDAVKATLVCENGVLSPNPATYSNSSCTVAAPGAQCSVIVKERDASNNEVSHTVTVPVGQSLPYVIYSREIAYLNQDEFCAYYSMTRPSCIGQDAWSNAMGMGSSAWKTCKEL